MIDQIIKGLFYVATKKAVEMFSDGVDARAENAYQATEVCGKCGEEWQSGGKFCVKCGNAEKVERWLFEYSPIKENRDAYIQELKVQEKLQKENLKKEKLQKKKEKLQLKKEKKFQQNYSEAAELNKNLKTTPFCLDCFGFSLPNSAYCPECGEEVNILSETNRSATILQEYKGTLTPTDVGKIILED